LRVFRPAVWQQRLIVLPQCVQIRQVVGEKSSNLVDVRCKKRGQSNAAPGSQLVVDKSQNKFSPHSRRRGKEGASARQCAVNHN
jgi:hypothetical protein